MTTKKKWLVDLAMVAFLIAIGMSPRIVGRALAAQSPNAGKVPVFEVDPAWPKLPNNWVIGNVSKIVVDRHDNVWLIHRPRTVPADKMPAPPVVELDMNGKFVQEFSEPGKPFVCLKNNTKSLDDYVVKAAGVK